MSVQEAGYVSHRGLSVAGGPGVAFSPAEIHGGGRRVNSLTPLQRPERWRDVAGFPGYLVSTRGRVLTQRQPWKTTNRDGVMRLDVKRLGRSRVPYWHVTLHRDGKRSSQAVHRLVLTAFAGPCPEGQQSRHGPGGSLDNRWPENLCYGTPVENAADQLRDGTRPRGEQCSWAKLDYLAVCICRLRKARGETPAALAREFGVSERAMGYAITGRTWAHVAA